MIDLMGNTTYTADELKARSMSRLAAGGLGYPELVAMLCRAVFALRGEYSLDATTDAQITGIGQALTAEEQQYVDEIKDNDLLKQCLHYEDAQARLSWAATTGSATDAAERAAAQAVVDAAPAPVSTLASTRAAARAMP
ncbi:MAG: hypothetical protein PHF75_02980 [Gallionella sp.]|nr:hypothetical protein [Gallionella sp.]